MDMLGSAGGVPAIRGDWRAFLADEVSGGAADRDRTGTVIPRLFLKEAARLGLLQASLPAAVGGGGMGTAEWGHTLEAVGYHCDDASFPLLVSLYAGVANDVLASGRDDLRDEYVLPFTAADALVSFAYTEDADPLSFTSTVRLDGDHVVVNADKRMVTGGQLADAFLVYVRNEATEDLDIVIVHASDPGVRVAPVAVMGVRAAGLAALRLSEVRVPASRVLESGDGISHVQRFLNRRRILLSCAAVGRMGRMLDQLVDQLTDRTRYRRRVADLQNVQASVGRMKVQLETSRFALNAALTQADGLPDSAHWTDSIGVAKYQISENAIAMSQAALRLTGGLGYTQDGRFERDVRDFMGLLAGAGAQDVLEVNLGASTISERERRRRFER